MNHKGRTKQYPVFDEVSYFQHLFFNLIEKRKRKGKENSKEKK